MLYAFHVVTSALVWSGISCYCLRAKPDIFGPPIAGHSMFGYPIVVAVVAGGYGYCSEEKLMAWRSIRGKVFW